MIVILNIVFYIWITLVIMGAIWITYNSLKLPSDIPLPTEISLDRSIDVSQEYIQHYITLIKNRKDDSELELHNECLNFWLKRCDNLLERRLKLYGRY